MRFSEDFLRELRERVAIADYAGKRLVWDKRKSLPAKGEYWACCPFHAEKSASFHVRAQQNSYYCFGCHAKGSVIDLAMRLEGLSFPEAVARLAEHAGMATPQASGAEAAAGEHRRRLLAAMGAAGELYRAALAGPQAEAARAYLLGRGLDRETWAQFGLGLAPDGWRFLLDRLTQAGFTQAELIEAGLVKQGEGRKPFDFFRNRIMFPIADAQGRTIAFGARTLEKDNPAKYLNSPETPLFHKGSSLYRLAEARQRLSRTPSARLVAAEGYMDVIALERAGLAAVAPLGTALTEGQLEQLWRLSSEPILCFDGDAAGQRAADRALDLALPRLGPHQRLRVAVLPPGKDPDDLFRSAGAESLAALVSGALPALDRLFARELAAEPLDSPEGKAGLRKRLRALARRIADGETGREYDQALQALANQALAEARPAYSAGDRKRGRDRPAPPVRPGAELQALARAQLGGRRRSDAATVESILQLGLRRPALLEHGGDRLADLPIDDPELDQIRHAILDLLVAGAPVDQTVLCNHLASVGHGSASARAARWSCPVGEPHTHSDQATNEWLALLEQAAGEQSIRREFRTLAEDGASENEALRRATRLAVEQAALAQRGLGRGAKND